MEKIGSQDIYIRRFKPKDLTDADYKKLGLVELVTQGYGYQGSDNHLLEQTLAEYDGVDQEERIDIFMALAGNRAVGSITVVNWSPSEPVRGQYFWSHLQRTDHELGEKALAHFPYAFEIIGIVTHPLARNNGIASRLLETAAVEFNPSFVLAQTKSPEAVITVSNSLLKLGYTTFFGDTEITEKPTAPHYSPHTLREAHLAVRGYILDEAGLLYIDPDLLVPSIPDVSNFPDYIKAAFREVIKAQRRVVQSRTAVKSLLSIHQSLI